MQCLDTARTSGHSNWHSSEEEKEQGKKDKAVADGVSDDRNKKWEMVKKEIVF